MPMGLPNWWRVFAYSVEVSSTFCAPPIISAHSAAVAHSSARFNAGHALCGAPISESAVSSTPSKRTSFQRLVISRVCSWCSDMPLGLPSTRKSEMPSSPSPRVRAATTMKSALSASGTKSLTPSSCHPPPPGFAVNATPPASHRPEGSVKASVALASPDAMALSAFLFCAPGLLEDDDEVEEGADAAVFLGDAEGGPAEARELRPERRIVRIRPFHELAHDLGRTLLGEKVARGAAEHLLLFGKCKVH